MHTKHHTLNLLLVRFLCFPILMHMQIIQFHLASLCRFTEYSNISGLCYHSVSRRSRKYWHTARKVEGKPCFRFTNHCNHWTSICNIMLVRWYIKWDSPRKAWSSVLTHLWFHILRHIYLLLWNTKKDVITVTWAQMPYALVIGERDGKSHKDELKMKLYAFMAVFRVMVSLI